MKLGLKPDVIEVKSISGLSSRKRRRSHAGDGDEAGCEGKGTIGDGEEREEHKRSCEKKHKQLEALKLSQDVECCVCLERVLSKPTPSERKFGILTECDHAFCIGCIRNWRSSAPSTGMDVNSTLRACPICRKLSYFVVPSVIWFSDPDEKKEIMDNYRDKLRSIDCKHFNFGDGNCPFGTSCFYKHTVKPGSYAWRHHRPPPRRPRPTPGSNLSEINAFFNMMANVMSEGEYGSFGFEDSDDDDNELTSTDMMMLLMNLDMDSDYDSSNEDSYLTHAFHDGRLEEVVLRHLDAEDGQTVIAKDISPAAIKSDVEELEQEVCRLHQQLQMAEEELRRYEPDPVRFTSMEDYEVCEKQLLDTLTHVVQRREYLVSSHLSSYETSTMQQGIAGPFANGVLEGWLPENGHNQVNLFDASAHSNQLRELSSAMYEPLMQGSSSSSNQNNMSECHVTNHNGDMFSEWAQAYSSSALFPSMNQHGSVGPSIEEMMPGQQSEIPAVTTMEAPQQAKLEVVDDYETRPKCGFLPSSSFIAEENVIKKSITRFEMHQVLKLHDNEISEISEYDPLDLFSGSKDRIHKAIRALYATPQNNFRVFLNGSLVFGGLGGGTCKTTSKVEQDFEDLLKDIIKTKDGSRANHFIELVAETVYTSGVLDHLLDVQKLDKYNIEGAVHVYYDLINQPCRVCKELEKSKTSSTSQFSSMHSIPMAEKVNVLKEFLISATAKDCSVMISFRSTDAVISRSSSHSNLHLESAKQEFDYKVHFIDLDMRPLKKMEVYYELDKKIMNTYLEMVKKKEARGERRAQRQ
ncbi:hypothetical protein F2Q70_00040348 [Brassica cretica]|uniref:Inositol-pentakisphosphate 2-kinase n=1 Tax=Brassica cretica TaxID=69181 RepID=A0A8S9KA47_BRACR|nr:hypothetical protein F2Q70_00040348 [Brassica cretica]